MQAWTIYDFVTHEKVPISFQIAIFAKTMVVSVFGDNGELSELMSIPLPSQPEHGLLLSFGDEENYIFGICSRDFLLISLDRKRVEFQGAPV